MTASVDANSTHPCRAQERQGIRSRCSRRSPMTLTSQCWCVACKHDPTVPAGPPSIIVDFCDCVGTSDQFLNPPTSMQNFHVDLVPEKADPFIQVHDLTQTLSAFTGAAYAKRIRFTGCDPTAVPDIPNEESAIPGDRAPRFGQTGSHHCGPARVVSVTGELRTRRPESEN